MASGLQSHFDLQNARVIDRCHYAWLDICLFVLVMLETEGYTSTLLLTTLQSSWLFTTLTSCTNTVYFSVPERCQDWRWLKFSPRVHTVDRELIPTNHLLTSTYVPFGIFMPHTPHINQRSKCNEIRSNFHRLQHTVGQVLCIGS